MILRELSSYRSIYRPLESTKDKFELANIEILAGLPFGFLSYYGLDGVPPGFELPDTAAHIWDIYISGCFGKPIPSYVPKALTPNGNSGKCFSYSGEKFFYLKGDKTHHRLEVTADGSSFRNRDSLNPIGISASQKFCPFDSNPLFLPRPRALKYEWSKGENMFKDFLSILRPEFHPLFQLPY